MSPQDKAVYLNAVPLLVVAASYLYVATALAVTLWRERERVTPADLALASIFPAVGIAAAVLGAVVFYDRSTIGAHAWPPFAACIIALVPALAFLFRGRERKNVLIGTVRAREAEELVSLRDRELDSVAGLARSLARTQDPTAAGRALLDEIESLLRNEFAALALIGEDGREAYGLVARSGADDIDWWATMRIDLRNEASGISSAYFEAAPVFVFDVESSPLVSKRLA